MEVEWVSNDTSQVDGIQYRTTLAWVSREQRVLGARQIDGDLLSHRYHRLPCCSFTIYVQYLLDRLYDFHEYPFYP